METLAGKHFLYRHIRLDKNTPFYIGIGTKSDKIHKNHKSEFKRAYDLRGRNPIWRHIANKTQYTVEILMESDSHDFIKEKEMEFIALYGRINTSTGTLANLTDGGEGTVGRIPTPESIQKTREAHSIPVYHKETNEVFSSILDACLKYNIDHRKLSSDLKKQMARCKFQYVDSSLINPYKNLLNIKILQKSTGKVFETMSEICNELKTSSDTMKKNLHDPESDFKCLSKEFVVKKNIDKRNTYVLDLETGIIYRSIIEAWKASKFDCNYNVFRSFTTKKLNFRYTPCDENGISSKRTTRLPKSEKQREQAANVWRGREVPEYIKKARKEATALKVKQKSTGIIFDSLLDGANFANLTRSTFRKKLNSGLKDFDFEYIDESLNTKYQNVSKENKLALNHRKLRNTSTQTSKYVGVSWDKNRKKWVVQCRVSNSKKVYLGRYDDEEVAAKVYQDYLEVLRTEMLIDWDKQQTDELRRSSKV